jgi:hypothetical protein
VSEFYDNASTDDLAAKAREPPARDLDRNAGEPPGT